jgi:predicted DNA-binding WGR domain protein
MQGSAVETQEDQERKLTKIYSNNFAFVAVKADELITAWGRSNMGGTIPASITTSD